MYWNRRCQWLHVSLITVQHTQHHSQRLGLHRSSAARPPTHSQAACVQTAENAVLRLAAWGAWLLGFLPGDFPTWLLQEADLLFSQRRPNVIIEEKAASNKGALNQSRGKVGPKILNRSFYRNGERIMKVFLKLIHSLQTVLVPVSLHSFLGSVPRPRTSPSLLALEISEW